MQLFKNPVVFTSALVSVLVANYSPAMAGLSESFTETAVSDDGRYILVKIGDRPLSVELSDERLTDEEKERVSYVRSHFPECGLYANDGSDTPLWTYDGRWSRDPIIAPDGVHVVFPGSWTWNRYEFRAVDFTCRGRTIRAYDDSDMIPMWWLKWLVNGTNGPRCDGYSFNPANMTFAIRTNQQEEFVFDVRTGKVIDSRSPFPTYFSILAIAFFAIVAGLMIWARHQKAIANAQSGAFGSERR